MTTKSESNVMCTISLEDYGVTPTSTDVWAVQSGGGGHEIFICNPDFIPEPEQIFQSDEPYTWQSFANVLSTMENGFTGEDALGRITVNG